MDVVLAKYFDDVISQVSNNARYAFLFDADCLGELRAIEGNETLTGLRIPQSTWRPLESGELSSTIRVTSHQQNHSGTVPMDVPAKLAYWVVGAPGAQTLARHSVVRIIVTRFNGTTSKRCAPPLRSS